MTKTGSQERRGHSLVQITAVLEKWDAMARETNEIKAKCFQN